MRRGDMIRGIILVIIIIFFAVNVNSINSFLSVNTDRTVEFGHSATIVPQAWNTTDELNLTNESKTPHAITNEYVYIDHWDDWPEDHITSISEAKFRSMENGNYKVLKTENATASGVPVSKRYGASLYVTSYNSTLSFISPPNSIGSIVFNNLYLPNNIPKPVGPIIL